MIKSIDFILTSYINRQIKMTEIFFMELGALGYIILNWKYEFNNT